MLVFHSKTELRSHLSSLKTKNHSIGMVPTMGALHQGHISLVNKAISENSHVVVSIFVNPTQFDNKEDLKKYPKTLDKDIQLLKAVSGIVIVFAPTADEMYEGKIKSKSFKFDGLEKVMEGEFRTGHFNGVATIVELLLRAVMPNKAYFGEKDFQQLQIIKKLVEIRKIPIEIIGCPIVRESNGLAMSSRNERLSKPVRKKAGFIYETLKSAKNEFGTKSASKVIEWVRNQFEQHPIFELEYIQITDVDTLTPLLRKQKDRKYRAFVAVYTEGVRLIDNIALN
ncbi:pantoate--beta-alanine ligase [Saonia flava]|uniref:Pantothenate synthetase n=1 Tax=Saonia flava TaxID=523696 RepID=A0A846QVG3_9FLAO|nr:pantoate--beta-alanine ligase [Saonia flava]NJB71217.1 pantoate--beta-alanine ligase [Saonia flava]